MVAAGPVRGADPVEVEALIAEGVRLRRAGNDAKALPFFQRAYQRHPAPRTAAQLGLVELQLGYHQQADEHLREALAARDDFWIRQHRPALERSLAGLRRSLGELVISGSPPGAEVRVNDRLVGTLPLPSPVRVGKGPVVVDVRGPGGKVGRRSFVVAAGGTERVDFYLGDAATSTGAGESTAPALPPPAEIAAAKAEDPPAEPAGARLSHARQLGAFLRMDVAVYPQSGQRLAPGLSYGLSEQLELGAAALIGKLTKGAWLGARYFLRPGAVKPALSAALPIFFSDAGPSIGLQGAAGVTVDLNAHAALFADLGAALFPGADARAGRLWLLPSLGVQGRY